jgi:hypothetical protein
MSSHILGVYFAPTHGRQGDRNYIAALQPPVVRILDPDVQQIADAHALAPNAMIAPRTWVIDDNNHSAVRALMADPVATGRDHAQQFRGQLDRWQREAQERGLKIPSANQLMFSSANEPNQGGTPDKIAAYSVAFFDRCTELGIRSCAPCLGVGWPDNNGPDTPVDWSPYAALPAAIKRGNHWLSIHEYFYKTGPQDGWRWWAGRHLQCPFDVPILLGEIGIDNYVDNERWKNEGGPRGWVGNVAPDVYARMIEEHLRGCDNRVVAGLPFITDYRDGSSWGSFDTEAAHGELLARRHRMTPQAAFASKPQPTIHIPSVSVPTPRTAKYVTAELGLNIRGGPSVQFEKIDELPYGAAVQVDAVNEDWARIGPDRWVAGWHLSDTPPPPLEVVEPGQPQPTQPSGHLDIRVLQAILNVESGGRALGENGKPIIRFENHVFAQRVDRATYDRYFRHGSPAWTKHEWRRNESDIWRQVHTGRQADEWAVYNFAAALNREAATESISIGAGQIMGFHWRKLGYANAAAMLEAFHNPQTQMAGMFVYIVNTPGLLEAVKRRDWRELARLYNGGGNVDYAAGKYEAAYRAVGGR